MLKKTKQDYCKISKEFSSSRQYLWPEILEYLNTVKDGETVLDFGCGNGRLAEFFKNRKVEYAGIDFCGEFIKMAKAKYSAFKNIEFIEGDVLNSGLSSGSYDKIFSIAVLHHIPSSELRLQFFKETKRLLKKNGIAVITVWNLYQIQYLWQLVKFNIFKVFGKRSMDFNDVLIPWKEGQKEPVLRYIHSFRRKELISLARRAGLKVELCGFLCRNKKRVNLVCIARKV